MKVIQRYGSKVVLGPVRLSHVHIFDRQKFDGDNGDGKYSVQPLVPKDDKKAVQALRDAIDAAYAEGVKTKWNGRKPPFANYPPMTDGDTLNRNGEPRGAECAGHYYVNAKTSHQPGCVDKDRCEILDADEVYSGMWGVVSINFYPYASASGIGVACALNNVMKYADGERFGGGASAAEDFKDVSFDGGDDDMDSL